MKTLTLTYEDIENIRWLASLVQSQATSEVNKLAREYIGYSDRNWMPVNLTAARTQLDRCEAVLNAINKPAALNYEQMRMSRHWPTPDSMRRVATALDALTPAKYGDTLRWFADQCDIALLEGAT